MCVSRGIFVCNGLEDRREKGGGGVYVSEVAMGLTDV